MESPAIEDHQAAEHSFSVGIVYNGVEKHEQVTRDETIKAVLDRAIQLFHVTQQPHMLSLFMEDGRELDDASTVGQSSITKKSVLYLRQSKVKGGACGW
jgi:hypothetical protein